MTYRWRRAVCLVSWASGRMNVNSELVVSDNYRLSNFSDHKQQIQHANEPHLFSTRCNTMRGFIGAKTNVSCISFHPCPNFVRIIQTVLDTDGCWSGYGLPVVPCIWSKSKVCRRLPFPDSVNWYHPRLGLQVFAITGVMVDGPICCHLRHLRVNACRQHTVPPVLKMPTSEHKHRITVLVFHCNSSSHQLCVLTLRTLSLSELVNSQLRS